MTKMKELILIDNKMNTIQFAELTGTQHKDVLKKSRKLLKDLGIETAQFCAVYKSPTGNKVMLELDRDLSLTLAGQYEPKIAYHVAKSFNSNLKSKPLSGLEQAKLQVKLFEALEIAEKAKLEAERKAIAKLNKIGNHLAGSTIGKLGNNIMFNQAAKILSTNLNINLGHNTLMKLCRDHGWLMSGARSKTEWNYPTQAKIKYFKLKVFHNPSTNISTITPVLTVEGLVEVTKRIPHWYALMTVELPKPTPPALPPALPSFTITHDCKDESLWVAEGWTRVGMIEAGHAI